MNVILVHGIFENGRLFHRLAQQLRSRGHNCLIPALKPNDARHGIADLSTRLKEYVENQLNHNERFVIVAFSMGCMVSRYYLQALGGINRCDGFFAISAPFRGTRLAYLHYGQGGRDLRPDSDFIRYLEDTESILSGLTIHTYRTPFDVMIVPSKSSHWRLAKNHVIRSPLHDLMPKNKYIINHIKKCLESSRLN